MSICSAFELESRVVMSLKMMPGFGKSGMSLILSRMICLSFGEIVFMLSLCRVRLLTHLLLTLTAKALLYTSFLCGALANAPYDLT